MKPHLLFRDRDFELGTEALMAAARTQEAATPQDPDLEQDLDLGVLLHAMAGGDLFLLAVARKGLLERLDEAEAILYRQRVLRDCLDHGAVVRQMYALAVDALERERRLWGSLTDRYAEGVLYRATNALQLLLPVLRSLRLLAEWHAAGFESDGFRNFLRMLVRELSDDYLAEIEAHVQRLALRHGVLISAELGDGNQGTHYAMRSPRAPPRGWRRRLQAWADGVSAKSPPRYVYEVGERDESGHRSLSQLRTRGIAQVARALGRSTEQLLLFLRLLRSELGFLIGCLNLHERLAQKQELTCFPRPLASPASLMCARGLYDVSLTLGMESRVVGNDIEGGDKTLIFITGANGGGKSTLLRGIGQAFLMMQAGMFVAASSLQAGICSGLFTHFRRKEDVQMRSGKLDEELRRMSSIVDRLGRGGVVLLNESFASTNEREGSEIARQIVQALQDCGVRIVYVTHMFELSHGLYLARRDDSLFLRADPPGEGNAMFRITEGEPLASSHGADLYVQIFGTPAADATADRSGLDLTSSL